MSTPGEQLYKRWQDATPDDMAALYEDFDMLKNYERARWEGLAEELDPKEVSSDPHDKSSREIVEMIIDHLDSDAAALDGTPFTAKAISGIFGTLMATTQGLAIAVRMLCEQQENVIDDLKGLAVHRHGTGTGVSTTPLVPKKEPVGS